MRALIAPGALRGHIAAIPSKSQAHRLMICAALADGATQLQCGALSEDIERTADCLRAMGAGIQRATEGFVISAGQPSQAPILPCGESGATFRFLLPVACALGLNASFQLSGRLPDRPMVPLYQALEAGGCRMEGVGSRQVRALGKLRGGHFTLPGHISSQFVSGLMLAAPLTGQACTIELSSSLESRSYVDMTMAAMQAFGIRLGWQGDSLVIPGGQRYHSPGGLRVEGDWSNAALWLCAGVAGGGSLSIHGLAPQSAQGDRAVVAMLRLFGASVSLDGEGCHVVPAPCHAVAIDISDTPDLAPALALVAAAAPGQSRLFPIARLRMKESDRAESICATLNALGGDARIADDSLLIQGGQPLRGGEADGHNDHRIVMMAALAAVMAREDVQISGAQAVNKSYPGFFEDMRALGMTCRFSAEE